MPPIKAVSVIPDSLLAVRHEVQPVPGQRSLESLPAAREVCFCGLLIWRRIREAFRIRLPQDSLAVGFADGGSLLLPVPAAGLLLRVPWLRKSVGNLLSDRRG